MQKQKRILTFLIVGFFICTHAFCGAVLPDSIGTYFLTCKEDATKVYLHLNKSVFSTGEAILLKSYVCNANLKPDTLTHSLYVVLQSSNYKTIVGLRTELKLGSVACSINIPDTLPTGYYYIRGYTNRMRNFKEEYFFTTRILLVNQADTKLDSLITNKTESGKFLVQFYPESGALLLGHTNRVIGRIHPFDTSLKNSLVTVFNDSMQRVDSTRVNELGWFEFLLKPDLNRNYFVQVDEKNIKENYFYLPKVNDKGWILQVAKSENQLSVNIRTSEQKVFSRGLKLIVFNSDTICFSRDVYVTDGKANETISLLALPKGMLKLVLFDDGFNLLSSRSFYVPVEKPLVEMVLPKDTFGVREQINLSVLLPKSKCIISKANLSVSVTRLYNASNGIYNLPIDSYLHLFSDMPHSVTNSLNVNKLLYENIDQFLIMQDGLHVNDAAVIQTKLRFCAIPETDGNFISGKVTSTGGMPLAGVKVFASILDTIMGLSYYISDADGAFVFKFDDTYNNKNIVFQIANSNTINDCILELDDKYKTKMNGDICLQDIPDALVNQLELVRNSVLIDRIMSKQKADTSSIKSIKIQQGKLHFYGKSEYLVQLSDFSEMKDFKSVVTNLLPGVRYKDTDDGMKLFIMDKNLNKMWDEPALILLNNIPFASPAFISELGSDQIDRIEVKQNHIIYGNLNIYGIVSIITKDKSMVCLDINRAPTQYYNHVNTFDSRFISPNYIKDGIGLKKTPDMRHTLYWDANVKIDTNGYAQMQFYASDIKGAFEVCISGFGSNGELISERKIFTVK